MSFIPQFKAHKAETYMTANVYYVQYPESKNSFVVWQKKQRI